ncbi:hypothetical protein HZC00_04010 [Candidatus Kaiserbacteria bacterium]|nr:hypothetical protein [Candidatus Kaiserbacteria bacterium]
MKKKQYLVLYMAPIAEFQKLMAEMADASPEEREAGMTDWNDWIDMNKKELVDAGKPLGKTKRVTVEGVTDTKNDIGGYSIVQAESHEEAAKLFSTSHPHFKIPGAWVDVMEIMDMPGM